MGEQEKGMFKSYGAVLGIMSGKCCIYLVCPGNEDKMERQRRSNKMLYCRLSYNITMNSVFFHLFKHLIKAYQFFTFFFLY